jgi:type III pantothenate kinase
MLLVIDVGNTHIVFGVYKKDKLINDWRIETDAQKTSDEYGTILRSFFLYNDISYRGINDIIISNVVPPLHNVLIEMSRKYFNVDPIMVEPGIKTGMAILCDNPKEVGADRIVNAVAAYEKHKRSLIIVDFGTATTFDYVNSIGEYIGGIIAPGIIISSEALFQKASKLPRIELKKPSSVIGKNTINSMQSGIIYGYVGLVDGIITRMKAEVREDSYVIATGGLAKVIAPETASINEIDDSLTLEGLRIIYNKNRRSSIR